MNSKIDQTLTELNASYAEKISVQKLARAVNLSESRLQHLFKSETGASIGQYVKNLRLQKARELLETTHLRVQQISFSIGYSHETHFVSDFKNAFGQTPAQYRETLKTVDSANK